MKIMFYNIAYGTGLDGSWRHYLTRGWRFIWLPFRSIRLMADAIRKEKPDVLCLAEVDGGSLRNRFRCQASDLGKRLDMPFWRTRSKYLPGSVWNLMTMVRKQNDAILSRIKGQFLEHTLTSGMKKLVQEYIVDDLSIFTVHLAVLSARIRQRQFRELADILAACPRPYLLCGDFNIHKGLQEILHFTESTGLRRLIDQPTFPSCAPRRHLDLFFASPDVKIESAGVVDIPYSDHLPVWVEITR